MDFLRDGLWWGWQIVVHLWMFKVQTLLTVVVAVSLRPFLYRQNGQQHVVSGGDKHLVRTALAAAVGVGASGRREFEEVAAALLIERAWGPFVMFLTASHFFLPYHLFLIAPMLGKVFLLGLVFMGVTNSVFALLFLKLLVPNKGMWDAVQRPEATVGQEKLDFQHAWVRELWASGPAILYGIVLAGFIAPAGIHPDWRYPVEITGGGLGAQGVNALLGLAVGMATFSPPVAALFIGTMLWKIGIALGGYWAYMGSTAVTVSRLRFYRKAAGPSVGIRVWVALVISCLLSSLTVVVIFWLFAIPIHYQLTPLQIL